MHSRPQVRGVLSVVAFSTFSSGAPTDFDETDLSVFSVRFRISVLVSSVFSERFWIAFSVCKNLRVWNQKRTSQKISIRASSTPSTPNSYNSSAAYLMGKGAYVDMSIHTSTDIRPRVRLYMYVHVVCVGTSPNTPVNPYRSVGVDTRTTLSRHLCCDV